MQKIKSLITAANLSLLLGGLASCVSTEVLEPESAALENSDEITISFRSPSDRIDTRADDTHKLRYTAFVIPRQNGKYNWNDAQRREITESDQTEENTIVFKVDPEQYYRIGVFADYIPSSTQADGNGHYADYYYDTRTSDSFVTLNPNPGNSSGISQSFFNNPYYDCFSYSDTIYKIRTKREVNCTLDRATAKVRFVDEKATPENFSNIVFSAMSYVTQFVIETQECANYSDLKASTLQDIKLTEMSNPDEHELFYFFTPASSKNASIKNLKGVTFTTTNSQDNNTTTTIQEGNIPIQKNFITTVKGNFVPALSNTPEPEPGPTLPEDGDLFLNVSVNGNWETEQKTLNP